ncbi:hypothetical protein CY34DRAFT_158103 [Suillus luteus UH-Slu-Lm8-n1]|uniref:Uncharacterized protein n=1 Tax=Suillus luteus UH-Slu-Lm8-n1 TaxID=930992 RepID=A0A0C9ZWM4_9AGAM|nr:hypothetical protein CY34DRAFT_158103 [Suillus luteus UH-Slu-Lm8-n1]
MALFFPLLGGPRGQVSEKDGDKVDGLDEGPFILNLRMLIIPMQEMLRIMVKSLPIVCRLTSTLSLYAPNLPLILTQGTHPLHQQHRHIHIPLNCDGRCMCSVQGSTILCSY